MLQRDGGSPERAGIEEPAKGRAPVDAPSNSRDGSAQNNARLKYSFPTQLIILALVAVLVIPGIAFAGLLLARYAHSERARYELEGVAVARATASVLDRHLNGLQTTLQTLSTSAFLAAGDLEGFYRQAERVKTFIGADIGLRRPDGQQIVNTRVPWGAALPPTPLAIDAQVIATGAPIISDVFTGAIANRPLVAIILPVIGRRRDQIPAAYQRRDRPIPRRPQERRAGQLARRSRRSQRHLCHPLRKPQRVHRQARHPGVPGARLGARRDVRRRERLRRKGTCGIHPFGALELADRSEHQTEPFSRRR